MARLKQDVNINTKAYRKERDGRWLNKVLVPEISKLVCQQMNDFGWKYMENKSMLAKLF